MTKNLLHAWTILCRFTSVDRDSNNLSILGILEELGVKQTSPNGDPVVVPIDVELISLWEKVKDDIDAAGKVKVEYVDPQGKILNTINYEVTIGPKLKRMRQRGKIQGLQLTVPGNYFFRVYARESDKENWNIMGQTGFTLKIN